MKSLWLVVLHSNVQHYSCGCFILSFLSTFKDRSSTFQVITRSEGFHVSRIEYFLSPENLSTELSCLRK